MMPAALASLADAFADPFAHGGVTAAEARAVVVTSWPTVPVEIIHAAGLRPVVVRGRAVPTPLADAVLEPHIFPNRLHQLVDAALAGTLAQAVCVVLPRTSDADYKAFLYLQELIRRHLLDLRAPILLFDLLQSGGPDVHAYDTARTRELFDTLTALAGHAGHAATVEDLRNTMARTDLARAARHRLMALRRGVPRVSGAEVLPLLGAFWHLAPEEYAALAHQAADILARRPPIDAPRVLLTGAPVDGPTLHAAIESHGAVVVAEPGPWGSDEADDDVMRGDDPFAAIAGRYRQYATGPRTPCGGLRRHAEQYRDDIDAVVVSLPPDDAVFGWEYPALRAWLEERRLPHVCVCQAIRARRSRRLITSGSLPSWRRPMPGRTRIMADKQLDATRAATEFQKAWFGDLRQRVFTARQPYALVQADVPFELFDLLEVPAVSNQWWAALIAARRQAPVYLDAMHADGLHDGLCRYCSLGYASTRYRDVQEPPWGGLPTPRLLCARLTCDCIHRVFSLWAEALGAELFEIDNPGASDLPPRWWERSRHEWRSLVEPHRLAFVAETLERLVARLEAIGGRRLDREALRCRLERVNQQEEIFDAVRHLIATAPQAPVRMTEQITNVMATQWVRGSPWAIAHARAFHDEVARRVAAGVAACPDERARLMWVGAGLWHDTAFYTDFETSHRAVFVWSMYLAFGPDGYIRYGLDDPMAALASRTASFNEYLHNPPWAAEWIVEQARQHRIDGALVLRPLRMKAATTGRLFIERALEAAGIPVLPIEADVVDPRAWDAAATRDAVRTFLDTRVIA